MEELELSEMAGRVDEYAPDMGTVSDKMFSGKENKTLQRADFEGYGKEDKEVLKKMLYAIRNSPHKIPPNLRYMDRKKVKLTTSRVNKIIPLMITETFTETNMLIRVAGNVVAE